MNDSPKPGQAPPGRVIIRWLGCKVNQAEAAWLGQALERSGWHQATEEEPAELALLLTCSVTASAARQSRQMARRLAREHPQARLLISGCDPQVAPRAYSKEGLATLGRAHLARLPQILAGQAPWPQPGQPTPPESGPFCPGLWPPGAGRSRSQLKVQDGCDAGCAYCIVPQARGRPRSLGLAQAQAAFQELGRAGAREVVLTGIHLGLYGRDLEPPSDLLELVRALLQAHPDPWLRLSSLEVNELGDELVGLMASEPRLCPHLHLPLQSGSDAVLAAMGRPYTAALYTERARTALETLPGLCLGADVLVGLPGEDQQAFEQTWALLDSLDMAYLHVFPYSPRPGTRAGRMPGRPAGPMVRQRAAALRRLGHQKRLRFYQEQVGRHLAVIMERSGLGRSANYCLVLMEDQSARPGQVLQVEVTGVSPDPQGPRLLGRAL